MDALKTHESENAVSHTTDAPSSPVEKPKPKAAGGFKLFGKKSPKTEEPPVLPAEPLTVDAAKAQALKAVDDAVEESKAKAEEAKKETPPPTPVPEKKPGFLAGLFGKKPAPPAPAPVVNEETIVVSSEKNVSDVVTSEGEVTSQSTGGFFSRVTKGKDKNEVEVKSGEVASQDVITAEGATHVQHIEGTDASVAKGEDGEQHVDLSTTDETVAIEDKTETKVERKPSLLKRLSGAVRATIAGATEEGAVASQITKVEEETVSESETTVESKTETTTTTTENVVVETKIAESASATVEVAA